MHSRYWLSLRRPLPPAVASTVFDRLLPSPPPSPAFRPAAAPALATAAGPTTPYAPASSLASPPGFPHAPGAGPLQTPPLRSARSGGLGSAVSAIGRAAASSAADAVAAALASFRGAPAPAGSGPSAPSDNSGGVTAGDDAFPIREEPGPNAPAAAAADPLTPPPAPHPHLPQEQQQHQQQDHSPSAMRASPHPGSAAVLPSQGPLPAAEALRRVRQGVLALFRAGRYAEAAEAHAAHLAAAAHVAASAQHGAAATAASAPSVPLETSTSASTSSSFLYRASVAISAAVWTPAEKLPAPPGPRTDIVDGEGVGDGDVDEARASSEHEPDHSLRGWVFLHTADRSCMARLASTGPARRKADWESRDMRMDWSIGQGRGSESKSTSSR